MPILSEKKSTFSIELANIACSPKKRGLDIWLPGTIHAIKKLSLAHFEDENLYVKLLLMQAT